MTIYKLLFTFFIVLLTSIIAYGKNTLEPRKVIILYEPNKEPLHTRIIPYSAEMPLNYLGLKAEYHKITEPLPDIKNDPNIRGVLTWFQSTDAVPKPEAYIKWLQQLVNAGKKIVILEEPGFIKVQHANKDLASEDINKVFRMLGAEFQDNWISTYHTRVLNINHNMMGFEKPIAHQLHPYYDVKLFNHNYESYLTVAPYGNKKEASDLVFTGPNGGYAATQYVLFHIFSDQKKQEFIKWIINPFLFFERAFDTSSLPKPDVTTLEGLRVFFSHIDGDGWNNVTRIQSFKPGTLSAEVIYQDILKHYSAIPVTVSAIAADIDPEWVGTKQSRKAAKQIFALENVQPATHTYSHPFDWMFFEDYTPAKEAPLLPKYEYGTWKDKDNETGGLFRDFLDKQKEDETKQKKHKKGYQSAESEVYDIPRAFANKPFDLHREIVGAVKEINQLTPKDKNIKVLLWSGDTSPWEEAIAMTRKSGLYNMNGGDSRFDEEFDSVGWVAPVGRKVGKERQIYSLNSNENTYTDLWTDEFFGYQFLTKTFHNTETPRRLTGMNIYYHMYSGERLASLNAVKHNIRYVQNQPHITITALDYIKSANAFYPTKLFRTDNHCWQVQDRENLHTIRMDHIGIKTVDFSRSKGIMGQNYYHNSLYIALQPDYDKPEFCLKKPASLTHFFETTYPYIITSTWKITQFDIQNKKLKMHASGWGDGHFKWAVPKPGVYKITVNGETEYQIHSNEHFVTFTIDNDSKQSAELVLEPL